MTNYNSVATACRATSDEFGIRFYQSGSTEAFVLSSTTVQSRTSSIINLVTRHVAIALDAVILLIIWVICARRHWNSSFASSIGTVAVRKSEMICKWVIGPNEPEMH